MKFITAEKIVEETVEKIHVNYDTHQKRWIAHNTSTSLRHEDQRKVLLWALRQSHPELYRVIKTISFFHRREEKISLALIDRLIKAAQLIAKGHVYSDGLVCSQNNGNDTYYHVSFEGIPKRWTCTCADFKEGGFSSDYGRMCTHTFALMIAGFLQRDVPEFYPGEPSNDSSSDHPDDVEHIVSVTERSE